MARALTRRSVATGLLVGCLLLAAAGRAAEDGVRIFVGRCNDTPLLNLRVRREPRTEGGATTTVRTEMRFRRRLGERTATVASELEEVYHYDASGAVARFSFAERKQGTRTLARGTVEGRLIEATVLRLGRSRRKRLTLPADRELHGPFEQLRRAVAACRRPDDVYRCCYLQLQDGKLQLGNQRYRLRAIDGAGRREFAVANDVAPGLINTVVADARGRLLRSDLDLGDWSIRLLPAERALELGRGAVLDLRRIVRAEGVPSADADNRYRLDPAVLALVAEDAFQRIREDLVLVGSRSRSADPERIGDLLVATDSLELDDPELRGWVAETLADAPADVAARAGLLRRAVAAHITSKGLGTADASALETFRRRTGDCTEHATLLCAALRIAEVPARIDYGLVYSPRHRAWIGHAWVSAYDAATRRWLHLDAALGDHARSTYIAFTGAHAPERSLSQAMTAAMSRVFGTTVTVVEAEDGN